MSAGRGAWTLAVPVAAAAAGTLLVTSALSADGSDLRTDNTDLATLVDERTDRVAAKRADAKDLRNEVDSLSAAVESKSISKERQRIDKLDKPAGLTRVSGSGLRVSLSDAPAEVEADGADPNLLVVHQQDIQAFVNALWAGGAEAITLQGQRLVSTTGIKCVGNTVVLDGVPYSPPYVIEAVGDVSAMRAALNDSGAVQTYREYAERYHLGLDVRTKQSVVAPAYDNPVDLEYATPAA